MKLLMEYSHNDERVRANCLSKKRTKITLRQLQAAAAAAVGCYCWRSVCQPAAAAAARRRLPVRQPGLAVAVQWRKRCLSLSVVICMSFGYQLRQAGVIGHLSVCQYNRVYLPLDLQRPSWPASGDISDISAARRLLLRYDCGGPEADTPILPGHGPDTCKFQTVHRPSLAATCDVRCDCLMVSSGKWLSVCVTDINCRMASGALYSTPLNCSLCQRKRQS